MPRTAKANPRRRLDADAARELILDAAEKRLVVVGPAGIRLQEVATDAGVSHPTVLHHFGSRELLVKAVITRSLREIKAHLVAALSESGGDQAQIEALLENVAKALDKSGHARVLLWLALEGHSIDDAGARLSEVVDVVHANRLARRKRAKTKPTREDTARAVVLAAMTVVCGSVLAPPLLHSVGLSPDGPASARATGQFRLWVTRLLGQHLDS